jgi:WD40 repeat protein
MFRSSACLAALAVLLVFESSAILAQELPDPKADAVRRLGSTRFRHPNPLTGVAFVPGDKIIASADYYGNVYLWDRASGQMLRQLTDRPGHIIAVAPDGKLLATFGRSTSVQLWSIATGQLVRSLNAAKRKIKGGPQGSALAFSPDGKLLVAALHDAAHVWEVESGKEVAVLTSHKHPVSAVAFAPDGKMIATGDSLGRAPNDFTAAPDSTITLWDAHTYKPLRNFAAHHGWIYSLSFSHDGKSLASASPYDVCVWRAADGHKLAKLESASGVVAFSPTANVLVTGRHVTFWDAQTHEKKRELDEEVSYGRGVAFSPDGKWLAVGNKDGLMRLWNAATGKETAEPAAHQGLVRSLDFSPDGNLLASTSGHDGTLRLWGTASGVQLRKMTLRGADRKGYEDSDLKSVRFSPDGKTLAVSTSGGKVKIIDVAEGALLRELAHDGSYINEVAWAPNGKYLASAGWHESAFRVWDAATGNLLHRIVPGGGPGRGDSEIHAVAFSPDSKLLATGSSSRDSPGGKASETIYLWDVATGQEELRFRPGGYPVIHLAFTGDGNSLVSSTCLSDGSTVEVWTVAKGKRVHEFPAAADGGNNSWRGSAPIALTQDGKLLATSAPGHIVVVRDVTTGQEIRRLSGHKGPITALAFSPDGQTLASGSQDTTILLWSLAAADKKPAQTDGAKELEQCWNSLTDQDPGSSYPAMWTMAKSRDAAVAFLKKRVQPAPQRDPMRIAQLVEKLGAGPAEQRDAARTELRLFGQTAEPALYAALRGKVPLPVRVQVEKLLATIAEHPIAPEELQRLRGVQVLEMIGTSEAIGLLEDLASGDVTAPLTRDANAALKRVTARRELPPLKLREADER